MARAHGEGSIYFRKPFTDRGGKSKPGTWVVSISLGDGRRKYFYTASEAEAKKKRKEAIHLLHLGDLPVGRRLTVRQFLEEWLRTRHDVRDIRPSTYRGYVRQVNLYLIPALGGVKLDELQPRHVQRMINEARANQLSARTIHHMRAVLHNALTKAVRDGQLTKNVAEFVDLPHIGQGNRQVLTEDEGLRFLEDLDRRGDRLRALYVLALLAGLRQAELLGLRWQDIDLVGRRLTVQKSLQRDWDGQLGLGDPKSERSHRVVPLPDPAVAVLALHKAQRTALPTAYVFATAAGKPLGARNVVRSFKRALTAAGLPAVRFHDLRHSCNTILHSLGVPARTRMAIMGHSDIRTTENIYTHPDLAQGREAMDKMGRAFAKSAAPFAAPAGMVATEPVASGGNRI